ncbi:MAG TPA: polymer-forming cytoskeletal protein [Nitrospirales bacterium]|nr:polymer-forming cytoskeletal protein [Nitrospirales bacterium]
MSPSDQTGALQVSTVGLEEEGYQMYLGQKCRLSGVLKVQGMARIDGFVEGEIYGSDLIQVGKEGTLEATVKAKDIVAQGPLRGEFSAQHKVQLLAPATLEGKIDAPVFLLEEGVFVNGLLKMGMVGPGVA